MVTASSATAEAFWRGPPLALAPAGWAMSDRLSVRPAACKADLSRAHEAARLRQFRLLSTSALALIHGIMPRSFSPICSIGCCASLARIALNEVWLTLFSSIQLRVKQPDWISSRMRFISARVSALMTRGPLTYSPYSAVLEIE